MRYSDSIEKSTEFLRQAVPMMSRQAAGLHPVSYAIWYEYVAGNNPSLRTDIDQLVQSGKVLDETRTTELFRKHISDFDEHAAQRVTPAFQKIISDMSRSAAQAGDEVDQFGHVLEKWSTGLSATQMEVASDVDILMRHTRSVSESVVSLKRLLLDSQREIEQLRLALSQARGDALSDDLSGLTNRKGFDKALSKCLASQAYEKTGPSLLIIDIDFFKQVNDNYGHLFGDQVIQAVAEILKNNVKGQDTAARYGGEEFVILLPATPLEGAHQLAEKIRLTVERLRIRRGVERNVVARITVSIGVASHQKGESAEDFIARADRALYASKHEGRNRCTVAGFPVN